MNMPDVIPLSWKLGAAAIALALVASAAACYHHHVFAQGEAHDKARSDAVLARINAQADSKLAAANAALADKEAKLAEALAHLDLTRQDLDHEKSISSDQQRALIAGDKRMSVLTRQHPVYPNGLAAGPAPADVDLGPRVTTTLDGRVASDLEWVRQTRNEAITRLGACIVAYDEVKATADALITK